MKKIMLLLLIIYVFPNNLHSQTNRFFLNLGTGISIPVSESAFSDLYNMGYNLHAAGGMVFSDIIAARLDLQLNRFPQDESFPNISGHTSITSLKADLLAGDVNMNKTINPYGVVGIGAYMITVTYTQNGVTSTGDETNFGFGLGGGINFKISPKIGIHTEIQYNLMSNDGAAKGYVPIKVGVTVFP